MYIKLGLILLFLFSMASCSPRVNVEIDSICSPKAETKKRFVLLPNPNVSDGSDLQYAEFSSYIEKALIQRGFEKALCYDDANVAIMLGYGISDPISYTYTYSVPVYGQTGVNTKTNGFIHSTKNNANFHSTTTSEPTYGIIGSSDRIGVGISYVRHFSLIAGDLDEYKSSSKVAELWSTNVKSVGESGDLRYIFPILVAASNDYIASNTGKKITVSISQDDKRISELR